MHFIIFITFIIIIIVNIIIYTITAVVLKSLSRKVTNQSLCIVTSHGAFLLKLIYSSYR